MIPRFTKPPRLLKDHSRRNFASRRIGNTLHTFHNRDQLEESDRLLSKQAPKNPRNSAQDKRKFENKPREAEEDFDGINSFKNNVREAVELSINRSKRAFDEDEYEIPPNTYNVQVFSFLNDLYPCN